MIRTIRHSRGIALATALILSTLSVMLFSSFASASGSGLVKLSSDPYTNSSSQHKTQVEPDNYSYGSTIVNVVQSGRFFDGGSSNLGWATSTDNGQTWTHGFMPGTTVYATPKGKYDRISDPAVVYDAKYKTWIASGLALLGADGAAVLVNRSSDGLKWANALTVVANGGSQFYDKDWIVCDNTSSSPYYGNCYIEYDNNSLGNLVQMTTSTDGGKTWGASKSTHDSAHGLGGQPLVQPSGTVVVPFWGNGIQAFTSKNGGSSWSNIVSIGSNSTHAIGGGLRSLPLPSAEIDGAGNVYVVWQACAFEKNCSANDIVMSTSSDGVHWSKVQRIPADPANSGVDHFIPGIAVDKATSGSSAHIGLTFYFYPKANCSSSTCQLEVGYVSSTNGGSTWSNKSTLAGPMNVTWLATTNQGYMVGDYISTEILGGTVHPVFVVAIAPKGKMFREFMYTFNGLSIVGGSNSSAGDHVYSTASGAVATGTAN